MSPLIPACFKFPGQRFELDPVPANGFSLVRKVIAKSGVDLHRTLPAMSEPLGDALLAPTRIYVKPVRALMETVRVKGMAHITGGGLTENTHRMFPNHLSAEIMLDLWTRPALFEWLQREGGVADDEMLRTFNCGIGFVLVVAEGDAEEAIAQLDASGESAMRSGHVIASRGLAQTIFA